MSNLPTWCGGTGRLPISPSLHIPRARERERGAAASRVGSARVPPYGRHARVGQQGRSITHVPAAPAPQPA
eukprot:4366808-Prymnesium_polylepis.1